MTPIALDGHTVVVLGDHALWVADDRGRLLWDAPVAGVHASVLIAGEAVVAVDPGCGRGDRGVVWVWRDGGVPDVHEVDPGFGCRGVRDAGGGVLLAWSDDAAWFLDLATGHDASVPSLDDVVYDLLPDGTRLVGAGVAPPGELPSRAPLADVPRPRDCRLVPGPSDRPGTGLLACPGAHARVWTAAGRLVATLDDGAIQGVAPGVVITGTSAEQHGWAVSERGAVAAWTATTPSPGGAVAGDARGWAAVRRDQDVLTLHVVRGSRAVDLPLPAPSTAVPAGARWYVATKHLARVVDGEGHVLASAATGSLHADWLPDGAIDVATKPIATPAYQVVDVGEVAGVALTAEKGWLVGRVGGEERWRQRIGNSVRVDGGLVVTGGDSARAIDAATGEVAWELPGRDAEIYPMK